MLASDRFLNWFLRSNNACEKQTQSRDEISFYGLLELAKHKVSGVDYYEWDLKQYAELTNGKVYEHARTRSSPSQMSKP
jgi:hypothetical protein